MGQIGDTMYLEPPSFNAHVRHERLYQLRNVTDNASDVVSGIIMDRIREAHKTHRPVYRTCRCLDGYTSSEFAYTDLSDAQAVQTAIYTVINGDWAVVHNVDKRVMDRIDREGEKCECPYVRQQRHRT